MMKQKIITAVLIASLFILGISATAWYYQHKITLQAAQNSQQVKQMQAQLQTTQKQLADQSKSSNHNNINTQAVNRLTTVQQQWLQQKLADNHFSGTVLIVHNNQMLYQAGRGYANYAQQKLTTPETTYQIASVQKSLTAALVMKAVEAGKLRLTDSIAQYYPKIPNGQQITLQMMLDMRSGLFEPTGPKEVLSDPARLKFAVDHLQVKNIGQHAYSPVNYLLLVGVLEQATHQSYQQLVNRQLIEANEIQDVGFVANVGKTQATSYAFKNNYYGDAIEVPRYSFTSELGTGNMYANVSGLYRIEQAIQQGKVIKQTTLQQLRHKQDGTYIGGVYNRPNYFYSHGIEYGYESAIQMSQDGNSGVVLLSNQYKADPVLVLTMNAIYQQFCQNTQPVGNNQKALAP